MSAILTSTSPHHLDVIACKMINLDVKTVPIIYNSIERGIVKEDFSDIELYIIHLSLLLYSNICYQFLITISIDIMI